MIPHVDKKRADNTSLADKPAILFVDGHISHEDPAAVQALHERNIDMYELLPHSSLVTQPLDQTVCGTWRSSLRKALPSTYLSYYLSEIQEAHASISPSGCRWKKGCASGGLHACNAGDFHSRCFP